MVKTFCVYFGELQCYIEIVCFLNTDSLFVSLNLFTFLSFTIQFFMKTQSNVKKILLVSKYLLVVNQLIFGALQEKGP